MNLIVRVVLIDVAVIKLDVCKIPVLSYDPEKVCLIYLRIDLNHKRLRLLLTS